MIFWTRPLLPGKNDTTRMTIAVLTGTSWILSESLGIRKPKCGCVCVQVICFEETKKKKELKEDVAGLKARYTNQTILHGSL